MVNFYISAFLADLALGAVLLSLPLLLIYKFGTDSLILGFFGALGSLVYSAGVIAAGPLSDRFNRKTLIISGCALFIAAYSIIPYLKNLTQVFIVYIFASFSMSMFWPTIQSWLSQGIDRDKLIRSLTGFNVCWSAGLTIGFLLAGILFSMDERTPFIFGVCLVGIIVLLLIKQPVFSEIRDEPAKKVFLETEKERPKLAKKFLVIGWCANLASWYIVGTVRNLFPKLGSELGFSSTAIGFFIFLMFMAQTIMFISLGRTSSWHYKIFPIVLFQILAVLSLLAIALFSCASYIAAAMIFLGTCCGMTYFSSIFYSLYGFIDKGKKSGIHEAFIGAGGLLGPLAGGIAAYYFGIRAPYLAAAALILTAIAVELILYRKK